MRGNFVSTRNVTRRGNSTEVSMMKNLPQYICVSESVDILTFTWIKCQVWTLKQTPRAMVQEYINRGGGKKSKIRQNSVITIRQMFLHFLKLRLHSNNHDLHTSLWFYEYIVYVYILEKYCFISI